MKRIIKAADKMLCAMVGAGDMAIAGMRSALDHLSARGKKRIQSMKAQSACCCKCTDTQFKDKNDKDAWLDIFKDLDDEQCTIVRQALERACSDNENSCQDKCECTNNAT